MNHEPWRDEQYGPAHRVFIGYDPAVPGADSTVCFDTIKGEIITMPTRCKFVCLDVTKTWEKYKKRYLYNARLFAVTEGSDENKSFFAYTPEGELNVQLITADVFQPGCEYYLDISEAQPVQAPATSER